MNSAKNFDKIYLEYFARQIIIENSLTFNEISTGAGELKNITLKDVSIIHLNAMTTIRTPKHFQEFARRVELIQISLYLKFQSSFKIITESPSTLRTHKNTITIK